MNFFLYRFSLNTGDPLDGYDIPPVWEGGEWYDGFPNHAHVANGERLAMSYADALEGRAMVWQRHETTTVWALGRLAIYQVVCG